VTSLDCRMSAQDVPFGFHGFKMNAVIQKVGHHLVGHCDCCEGYRWLSYHDQELGFLCLGCADHSVIADIELNWGGYDLCRPSPQKARK
jgi:hypothetical protein